MYMSQPSAFPAPPPPDGFSPPGGDGVRQADSMVFLRECKGKPAWELAWPCFRHVCTTAVSPNDPNAACCCRPVPTWLWLSHPTPNPQGGVGGNPIGRGGEGGARQGWDIYMWESVR